MSTSINGSSRADVFLHRLKDAVGTMKGTPDKAKTALLTESLNRVKKAIADTGKLMGMFNPANQVIPNTTSPTTVSDPLDRLRAMGADPETLASLQKQIDQNAAAISAKF